LIFLIDTQLPKALAIRLRSEGYKSHHVLELGMGQSSDNDLWVHAYTHGFVIITKDEDFAQWTLTSRPGPQIIWLRIGNCKNTELIDWLMPMWLQVIDALEQGERLIEIE
jgi:predicted nuclease of predicted toxin-antitoxin system